MKIQETINQHFNMQAEALERKPMRGVRIISGDLETVGSIIQFEGDCETNPVTRKQTKTPRSYRITGFVDGRPQLENARFAPR